MNNFNFLVLVGLILIIASCGSDSEPNPTLLAVEPPSTYNWVDSNGNSTVSFSGQTTRSRQASEICALMGSEDAEYNTLDEMFNLGEGFSDATLNYSNSSKKVANKTGAYSANATAIQTLFNSWIIDFTSNVKPAMVAGTVASPGTPGVLPDGISTRELNAKGMELDQLFTKGLIGALCADQIIYGYLSDIKVGNDVSNERDETGGYTTMEHHWDEGYGYLFGMQADPTTYDLTSTNGDVLLYKYYAKSNFSDIQMPIYDAFRMGREAITMDADNGGTTLYSDVKMNEALTIKNHISHIIGQKAYDYINGAAEHLEGGGERNGDFFHGLSEGVGFVVSLQFTYNEGVPYFSYSQVNDMLNTLSSGDGLWDVTTAELNQMASNIKSAFNL
ncbi:MAG: DUF4856 domain-containing protein [Flavobacteriales bacterium]